MKPMLSATLKEPEREIRFPVLCSPKLDGIRCLIVGRVPVSRNHKHIPNQHIFNTLRGLNLPELDGELIIGKPTAEDCYRVTNSGVMGRDGEPNWRYHIFDLFDDGPFHRRLEQARRVVRRLGVKRLRVVPHKLCRTVEEVLAFEEHCLLEGYEGVMGRDPNGLYKQGRSTIREAGLWKLKRFVDGEAEVLGFDERMHNANEAKKDALGRTERSSHKENLVPMDTLGSLKVRDTNTGVKFDIGTGFTDLDRDEIWRAREAWVGKIVKYKSMPIGVKDKPRFPVYLGERKDL